MEKSTASHQVHISNMSWSAKWNSYVTTAERKVNQTLFESRLGKSYPTIVFEEAAALFSPQRHTLPKICGHCIGTGTMLIIPTLDISCPFCNGTGQLKKCGCGSGILIGKNEPFCIRCKPQPEPDLSVLISRRCGRLIYHDPSGLYYFH